MNLLRRLADRIIARAVRDPYFHITSPDGLDVYMFRYWLLRPRKWLPFSIRVHHILRSDDDRCLHDHPWAYCSVILRGGYTEITPSRLPIEPSFALTVGKWHGPGSVLIRRATSQHRLVVPDGDSAWTLFIMGRRVRKWGFHTPYGWCPWDEYLDPHEVAEQKFEHAKIGVREPA